MTQPDEATTSAAPRKAHGDPLQEVVEASADAPNDQPTEDAETDQDG
jgi:hypothetical protein